ncbi:MAG: GIY-YIG nuclease family protein [Planctomycetia bacterium]|nr:MAG: GIY-YIG nuclease family protein [Planctomycetia bacterium]
MNRGRTIRIHLVEGAPTGTLTAEIMNWTGKVVVFSRSQLADAAKRAEAHRTGIYFLVGSDPDNPAREWVYIGEADDVLKRLAYHDRDERRDFWQRTVFIVSKDENLTKAHARYLESRLIQMANEAHRAKVRNDTAPPTPALPEADVADMEYFLEQVVMMMPVLGFGFLQPSPRVELAIGTAPQSPLFRLAAAGVQAEARVVDGQFVVLKGSTARKQGVDSWTSYKGLRADLIESGRIVEGTDPQILVFEENVSFDSPSAAAAVVLGRNSNGRLAWKVADTGKTYADWQALQLELAGVDAVADESGEDNVR